MVEVDVVSASSEGLVVVLVSSIALVELIVPSEPPVAPVVTSGSSEGLVDVVLAVSISAVPMVAPVLASSASTVVVVGGILVAAIVTSVSTAPSSPEPEWWGFMQVNGW